MNCSTISPNTPPPFPVLYFCSCDNACHKQEAWIIQIFKIDRPVRMSPFYIMYVFPVTVENRCS